MARLLEGNTEKYTGGAV